MVKAWHEVNAEIKAQGYKLGENLNIKALASKNFIAVKSTLPKLAPTGHYMGLRSTICVGNRRNYTSVATRYNNRKPGVAI